jgi:hypothetical protein
VAMRALMRHNWNSERERRFDCIVHSHNARVNRPARVLYFLGLFV